MIRQLLFVGVTLVVATSAVSLKNLQQRASLRTPLKLDEAPESFLEAGYAGEDFDAWNYKQEDALDRLNAPLPPTHRQVITKFHQVDFYDHGYQFEPQYEDEQATSLLETSATLPAGDFHRDSKFVIGIAPSNYREAIYWDSPATSFFEESESKADLHNTLQPEDLPVSFIEAGYEDEPFFPKDANAPDYMTEHKFQIGFAPASYREALYWDSPASAFFEMSEDGDSDVGEDFRISPHGRTEDVNDPDYEINHPTDHKHTKNVIGTKQEGHLFWTDTTQPNPETYESTFHERERLANTVEADDQAVSVEINEDDAVQLEPCGDCEPTPHHPGF